MNGYSLKDYPNFTSTWSFVTVRYRKDSGEMRITYANELAWKTLKDGRTDYPDGAIFAKIGLMTEEDKGFVSSMVPSGAKRYQLMVMDKAKNKDTDGWGYAVFDAVGKTFGGDPHEKALACHACHKLVPERGYVFSLPIKLSMGLPGGINILGKQDDAPEKIIANKLRYETADVSVLPEKLKTLLPDTIKKVRILRGELENTNFQGTMGEIRPSLAQEAMRADMPAALINKDKTLFSLVMKDIKKVTCTISNEKAGIPLKALFSEIAQGQQRKEEFFQVLEYCDAPSTP